MEHYAWIPYLSVSDMAYPYTCLLYTSKAHMIIVTKITAERKIYFMAQNPVVTITMETVSYTHLDVYKRQPLPDSIWMIFSCPIILP